MTLAGSGPGKTAPKLQLDFLAFDPVRVLPQANNLTQHPLPVGEGPVLAPAIGGCRHDYTTKPIQSVTPPPDSRPDGGSEYKVAVICKKCRIHADISIGFTYAQNPCPNQAYPLHHFQRVPSGDYSEQTRIVYLWQCSAPQCRALLNISLRLPRLPDVNILTNTDLLKRRYEDAVQDSPAREGLRQATPVEVLARLRKYIRHSLNAGHQTRTIPADNKRFIEAFGVQGRDCTALLEFIGFQYGIDPEDDAPYWALPQPAEIQDRLRADGSSQREILEDLDYELRAWMSKVAFETGVANPVAGEGWPSADRDIERVLAAQNYVRRITLRRTTTANSESIPYFASLGILPDFCDDLVEFAFDRQIDCDPENRAYYLECLQVISEQRNTEQLHMKVATLVSQDLVSRRDLSAAYRALNIPVHEQQETDDERILNLFHVLISDSGVHAQENARQALYKIGVARNSQRLMNASRQALETYEDALTWLGNGVNKDTPDDGLVTIVTIKMDESKSNAENAQKAISIIANHRKSDFLNGWLLNFGTDGQHMSPDEALRHLGVEESFSAISHDMLPTLYAGARTDRPGEQTEKAIAVLQKAASGITSTQHPVETWPVGLKSHGNTCYLNSLLQYYFSIAPLRDIVLDYEQYKLDTTKFEEKTQRVGQRKISMVEIKGGQRFAEDLKHLFERMIKDPTDNVKPEEDLVCRAFLEPKDYALLASAVQEEKAAQIPQSNGLESAADEKLADNSPTTIPADHDARHKSDASSVTIQFSDHGDGADTVMKDGDPPLTPPASPSAEALTKEKPDVAPPLPPRRFSVSKDEALRQAKENARQQQDVTEVHDSIMFRLRSGMMPNGKDASEEQEDALRDLFKIGLIETAVKNGEDGVKKELFDTSVQLNVPTEDTDIYSALDAVFDLQAYEQSSAGSSLETYRSIKSLPPLLQINIPRIGFDKNGRGGAYKSDRCIKLDNELYFDRYTDAIDPAILPKRKSCWGWRKKLHALRKEQKALSNPATELDGPTAIEETSKYLTHLPDINDDLSSIGIESFQIPSELLSALNSDAETLNARLDALKSEIRAVENQLHGHFTDFKKLKYRLAAVFFHRGNFGHGHYWIYIYDFVKAMWRVYNDEKVEEFTKPGEILEARDWGHGTPTYAVYVKDGEEDKVIQPVCRAPEKLPTPEPNQLPPSAWTEDVQMVNGDSQAAQSPPLTAIDPKLTIIEGGVEGWEEQRQVPNVKW